VLLFLYGTLLEPARLARCVGRPVALAPAWLRGWRRVAMRGGRYPTLVRARGCVRGAVAVVDAAGLRRLSTYEGPLYELRRLAVRTGRGNSVAGVWIARAASRREWEGSMFFFGKKNKKTFIPLCGARSVECGANE
jgi:gamma-glutamylcyclotransferase (GGCT)/AIG2-like uncharacterized protein YtfP